MKRSQIVTAAGIIIALSLGLILAYPLIATQMPTLTKPDVKVAVAYAYISTPLSNSTIPGLSREADESRQTQIFSYLIIMNVTNNSNDTLRINSLSVLLGPNISVGERGAISAVNLLIKDHRSGESGMVAYDNIWNPQQSRLICLSGMTGIPQNFYDVLNRGDVWVLGSAEATIAFEKSGYIEAKDLRQIPLQTLPEGYLYNSLIDKNQMLSIYGLDATVIPRNLD